MFLLAQNMAQVLCYIVFKPFCGGCTFLISIPSARRSEGRRCLIVQESVAFVECLITCHVRDWLVSDLCHQDKTCVKENENGMFAEPGGDCIDNRTWKHGLDGSNMKGVSPSCTINPGFEGHVCTIITRRQAVHAGSDPDF